MAEVLKKIQVSIVVPMHNEANNAALLFEKITAVMRRTGKEYEVIFVNDGSKDNTMEVFMQLRKSDPHFRYIWLRRNFGQTAALAAGFDSAKGDVIISMDGDLQHDPEEIPSFLKKIEEGYDIVNGWRCRRRDNLWMRRIPSYMANKIMCFLSGVRIRDFGSTYKAYKSEVVSNVDLSSDLHRFIPAIASLMGVKIVEIPIVIKPRLRGRSHYGLSRILSVLCDFLIVKFFVTYYSKPMRFFGFLGILSFGIGSVAAFLITVGHYFFALPVKENQGNIILSVFLMLSGLQFIFAGILAELYLRIYRKSTNQKIYWIKNINSFPSQPE